MNNTLDINYTVVFYMIVGLFGLAGFLRGWWKEAITTGLLTLLLIMLEKPDLAQQIIDSVNNLLDKFRTTAAFSAAGSLAPTTDIQANQRETYIIVLIALVIVSYFIGNMTLSNDLTAGGRIFGGMLGFTNGFIALSLFKEYILGRFLPGGLATELGAASAASAATAASIPDNLTLSITNVPKTSITDGFSIWIFIVGGALLFLFALTSRVSIERGKISKRPPLGYK